MERLDRVRLAGKHVRLEPLLIEHAGALLRTADEARETYAFQFVADSLPAMQSWIAAALAEEERGESLPFAVFDAAGDLVGSTRYMTVEWWAWPAPPPAPVPLGPDVLEIGWTWYAQRVQRTGVNTEAKLLLCTHAFEILRVRRVSWKTDARNARSRAAILRLGAHFDGILRAHKPATNGVVRDSAYFSMLASEWPEAKQRLVARLARGPRSR